MICPSLRRRDSLWKNAGISNALLGPVVIDSDGFRPNVGIILCNDENRLFWGRRVGQNAWQFPQGGIQADETPEQAMFRELQEEVGYGAETLARIASLSVAPGYLLHETHIILAQNLYPSRLPGDEPEPIEVVPWELDQLPQLLRQREFTEARSIAAAYMVQQRLSTEAG